MAREIHVFADWPTLGGPTRIGLLRAQPIHGQETFSFEYDRAWLECDHNITLDPQLQLFDGPQYQGQKNQSNFGLFLDSSPDRWGRLIMQRREAALARKSGGPLRPLLESDYLLGVHDAQRMGALRFKETLDGKFQSDHGGQNAPPWTRLRELENAAWQFQSTDSGDNSDLDEWLTLLVAPGSSIGGARPKAGVIDEDGHLWIAKFPGRSDVVDVAAWEIVVHELADNAGLTAGEARAEKFGQEHHTFLTKRFDRALKDGKLLREHFASAMTMLGYNDGVSHHDGVSYLEIVEFLMRHGAAVEQDLPELWRRIVFSICVSNTDDHLRNHGFLLTDHGWRLSPAYDINPNPAGRGLHLNISEADNALNLALAREVAEFFRVDDGLANDIIERVRDSVAQWRSVAAKWDISRPDQELMAAAFEVASAE